MSVLARRRRALREAEATLLQRQQRLGSLYQGLRQHIASLVSPGRMIIAGLFAGAALERVVGSRRESEDCAAVREAAERRQGFAASVNLLAAVAPWVLNSLSKNADSAHHADDPAGTEPSHD